MSHLNRPIKMKQNSGELPTQGSVPSAERTQVSSELLCHSLEAHCFRVGTRMQTQIDACAGDPGNVPRRELLTSGVRREHAGSNGRSYKGGGCAGWGQGSENPREGPLCHEKEFLLTSRDSDEPLRGGSPC